MFWIEITKIVVTPEFIFILEVREVLLRKIRKNVHDYKLFAWENFYFSFWWIQGVSLRNLDFVEFKIKHQFENSYPVVEKMVYPVICSDIKDQPDSVAKEQYDHISRLTLSKFED